MTVQPPTPPASPPPTLHVGASAPDFLPGAMTSPEHDPLPHQNHVDTNDLVKDLCRHTMKAYEISMMVETEIRHLRAENASLRGELPSNQARPESSPLRVAPFDPPEGLPPWLANAEGRFSVRSSGKSSKGNGGRPSEEMKSQALAWNLKTSNGMDQVNSGLSSKIVKAVKISRLESKERTIPGLESKQNAGVVMDPRKAAIKRHLLFDPERIKSRLREAIIKPVYDVTQFYHNQGVAQAIARSTIFDHTTLVVIMLNAIWIAVDTQHNRADVLVDAEPVFQIAEHLFCTYFFLEWAIRLAAFKRKRDCKNDVWFVFDTVLMVSMVTETWIMTFILLIFEDEGGSSLGILKNASLVRMLRLLRITRLARAVKLLRFAPEVMVMLKAVVSSMRCVLWTFVLLICIVFFFGVAFTQLCRGSGLEDIYFKTLTKSMHTLLIAGVFPDLLEMSADISNEHIIYWFFWIVFMLLVSLAVLNLLVGVLVEIVKHSSNVERDAMDVAYTRQTFLKCLGVDKIEDQEHLANLTLSKEEFADLMEDDGIIGALLKIGIDVLGLVDLADWIFISGERKFPEVLEVILQLRSSATVTVRDLVDLRKFLTFEIHKMQADLYFLMRGIRPDISQCLISENRSSCKDFSVTPADASYNAHEHIE